MYGAKNQLLSLGEEYKCPLKINRCHSQPEPVIDWGIAAASICDVLLHPAAAHPKSDSPPSQRFAVERGKGRISTTMALRIEVRVQGQPDICADYSHVWAWV